MPQNNTPQTKADRRDAARAEAVALARSQAKRDKRNRLITIGALVVGVVVLAGIIFMILREGNKAPLEGVNSPTTANDTGGISLGKTGEAGTANEGAPELVVYLDYMCPICGQFEQINGATLDQLREDGDVTVVVHPVSILDRLSQGSQYSTRAAAAAAYVAENAPEAFADFNAAMFTQQPKENTAGLTNEQIQQIAVQAGVPEDVAKEIGSGAPVKDYGTWVEDATTLANTDTKLANPATGGFGTPTLTLDGELWGSKSEWQDPAALPQAITDAQG